MKMRIIERASCLAVLMVTALSITSCGDDLIENPVDILVPDNLYTDKVGFEAGLNALYDEVRRERVGYTDRSNEMRGMVMTIGVDNAWSNFESSADGSGLFNTWGTNNTSQVSGYLSIWAWLYETINAANTIVVRAENPDVQWTEAEKNEVVAEARFFRAWAYRHLTYLWGDVPLNLDESSGSTIRTDWNRTPRAEVRKQIEADLLFAEQYLPPTPRSPGRVSSALAEHYLAELYLAMGEPAKAEEKARAVTESGLYHLIDHRYGVRADQPGVPFMDQFYDGNVSRNQGNTEILWSLQLQKDVPGGGLNIMRRYWTNRYYAIPGLEVSVEYGGRGIGVLSPTSWALNLYEPGDDRGSIYAVRKFYLYNNPGSLPDGAALGDTVWLSSAKYSNRDPLWPSTRKWESADPLNISDGYQYGDQPYVRLAETYLLLAEALFDQGKLGPAADAINTVRLRSHASPISAGDVTLDFILDERSRELLTEEHRRYTLLRTHTWLRRTKSFNPLAGPNIVPRDTLLPIPQQIIDANLTAPMPQNPGY